MSEQTPSFTTAFTVDQTPEEAFTAICNVRGWWTGDIAGTSDRLGDEFTYRYEDLHMSRQRVTEFTPGQRLSWAVLDSRLSFVENSSEWTGTTISFEISRQGSQTEVRFTHHGLRPACQCFEGCSNAWSFYINDSLRSLISTGQGDPGRPADGA